MTGFEPLLKALLREEVDFIVVGGVAGILHGAARVTFDLDIVYGRDEANLTRLCRSFAGCQPYLRGAPPGLPFVLDLETLRRGLNFTLVTTEGDIDLLGDVTGGGGYNDLLEHTVWIQVEDLRFRCVTLPKLIALKRAAGRPRDLAALAELEVLLEEQRGDSTRG